MSQQSASRAFDRLKKHLSSSPSFNQPLARFTTLRVGGPARILATAETIEDLRLIRETAGDYELPVLMLGRGSNLLVSDEGFEGIVLRLGREFNGLKVEGNEVFAGGAVTLTSVIQAALKHALGGMAFAVGIPGTVGAAIALNAGAHGSDMSRVVRRVTLYGDGGLTALDRNAIGWRYRGTDLPAGSIVVEATLALAPAKPEIIKSQMEQNFRRRKETQPLSLPNAGSFFKNPDGQSAGELIERAGCKGLTVRGAQVSSKHANFFVNVGGATALDFFELFRQVRRIVHEREGVWLEPEVRLVGEFPS